MAIIKRLAASGIFRRKKTSDEKITLLQKFELALKTLTLIAAVVGGFWAFHLYKLAGGNSWAINLKIETKVQPYHDNLRLLIVNVKTINPRNFEIELNSKLKDRYELSFNKIPGALKENSIFDEDGGDLIQKVSLLPEDTPYDFVPGIEFDDMRTIVVPAKSTILIKAEIQAHTGELDEQGKPDTEFVSSSTVVHIE
ncbi:MAG TPA: hypothetical protein VIU46_11745 [Gallionellaceae bacterium]